MKYYIGVDIGGTNIAAGIVDEKYAIVHSGSIKTIAPRSAESICDDIAKLCGKIASDCGISFSDIQGIGVASPGIIKNGVVVFAKNLDFDNVPLKSMLEERTGKHIAVCNDANAAALAECMVGSGKGCGSLVAVTIGTGIGGGIVINGRIFEGFNGAGAEIGHIVIVPDGRLCVCGNRGCFETYCSASALIRDTKEAMMANKNSALWKICGSIDRVDGKSVYDAAKLGDATAEKLLDRFVRYLSIGVSNIVTLLQPDVVCIGGGMSEQEDALINPLVNLVNETGIIKELSQKTRITAAALYNEAGIIGAAADIIGEMNNGLQ